MGDPDLRSDETVLVRTQGVYVKSIPFECIITNKRIILIDRANPPLPPKEIPLATIKDVEGGANAISNPVVTLTVITRTGEIRQMVLTFSRQEGYTGNVERDKWVKILKEAISSSFEQVIRKVNPNVDHPQRRSESSLPPRVEMTRNLVPPVSSSNISKHDVEPVQPIKKIIEDAPPKIPAPESVHNPPVLGIFCSHCGNQVPEGSGFCNRCGSSIIPLINSAPVIPTVPEYRPPSKPLQPQTDLDIDAAKPLFNCSQGNVPAAFPTPASQEFSAQKPAQLASSPMYENPPDPEVIPESVPAPAHAPVVARQSQKPVMKPLIPRLFSQKELSPTPLSPPSMPKAASIPPQKPRRALRLPGKNVFLAMGVVILLILIAVLGVVFVYPMSSGSGSTAFDAATAPSPLSPPPVMTANPVSSSTIVVRETTVATGAPATGVYAHVNYLGSWKVSYGTPSALKSVSDSGDKFLEIENATGPVQVTAEKLDCSTRHDLVVEIYKNGGLLTTGQTSVAYGKVMVSSDVTTGGAQASKTMSETVIPTTRPLKTVTTVTITSSPATGVKAVKAKVTMVKKLPPVTKNTTSVK